MAEMDLDMELEGLNLVSQLQAARAELPAGDPFLEDFKELLKTTGHGNVARQPVMSMDFEKVGRGSAAAGNGEAGGACTWPQRGVMDRN